MRASRPKPIHRIRDAFTLIELLTVIAIIGILAAILIPVVGAVRESARASQCVGNLRSTSTAMISHIMENDGILRSFRGGSNTRFLWTRVLGDEGYFRVEDETIFCPSWDDSVRGRDLHDWHTYGLNLFDPRATRASEEGTNFLRMNFNNPEITPSRYILFADSLDGNNLQIFRLHANQATDIGSVHLRHNDRANVAFLDGHVASHGVNTLGTLEPTLRSGFDAEGNVVEFPQTHVPDR